MDPKRVSTHFLACHGLEHLINRMAEAYLKRLFFHLLQEYRTEAQVERARLMRQNPLDYRAVRAMDFEMEDVTRRLQRAEIERAFSD